MKTYIKLIALTVIVWTAPVAIVLLASGCETTSQTQSLARLAVQYATVMVVENNPERVARVIQIADGIRQTSGDATATTVAHLEALVRDQIRWENLDDRDTALVHLLIRTVRQELEARLGSGLLGPENLLIVNTVAGWIIEAARATVANQVGPVKES